jgi:ribosome-associated protein
MPKDPAERHRPTPQAALVRRPQRAAKRAKPKRSRPTAAQLAVAALDDLKAQHVSVLDVRHLTSMTDTMVIADGRSDRHVRALADAVVERCKSSGIAPLGIEGQDAGEWVLVDLGDTVVHLMLPRVREFYKLEKLWDISAREEAAER